MKSSKYFLSIFIVAMSVSLLYAQDAPELPKPDKAHALLDRFVGEWTTVSETVASEQMPAMTGEGKMSSRKLGEFWVVNDIEGDMMETKVLAVQTLGYDPSNQKYVATWVDSMVPHRWDCIGTLDANGHKLTLEAEGPNFMTPGKTCKFRDVYEFKSQDEITMTSSMLGDDGKWVNFMTGKFTRKK